MSEEKILEEISISDLVSSLVLLWAQEAGLLGDSQLSSYEIGALGAATSELLETYVKLESGEISAEEAEAKVKQVVYNFIGVVISKAYDAITIPIALYIKEKVPNLSKVVDIIRIYVRRKVVENGVQLVTKAFNWIKEKIKL